MSKKSPQQADSPKRGISSHVLPRLSRGGRQVLRALSSRSFALVMFTSAIAVELTVLGIGVTRRLDQAYERSLEVSKAQLAVIEARELAQMGLSNQGSAGIEAKPTQTTQQDDTDAPPPLRVRDIDTILAQDGGFDFDEPTPPAPDDKPSDAQVVNDATSNLSQEDKEEVERLIRQGVAAMAAGDMRQCVLYLEEGNLLCPNHPALLYYYGMAYDKLQNPRKAREFYTRVFQMRDQAGSYFKRASHRLTYGSDQASAMRGKLSFGPHQVKHEYSPDTGEEVRMLLPVLLAPGEEVRLDDLYIHVQFFDLVNGRRIQFSRGKVNWNWENESPDWSNWEENLMVSYTVQPLSQEEMDAYGDLRYYGFTAKLYYKGEPLDCISSPSALILQEQRLNTRNQRQQIPTNSLLPDDGLAPEYEEAIPSTDFLPELPLP